LAQIRARCNETFRLFSNPRHRAAFRPRLGFLALIARRISALTSQRSRRDKLTALNPQHLLDRYSGLLLFWVTKSNQAWVVLLASLFVLAFAGCSRADDVLDFWHFTDPRVLNKIRYAAGLFVGVGPNGTILTSPDGKVWTARNSGTTSNLKAVTWGSSPPLFSSLFVAVGNGATILISTDAINWTLVPTSYFCDLNDVAFGWPYFVAATSAATTNVPNFLISSQGTGWSGAFVPWNPAGQGGQPYRMDAVCAAPSPLIAAGGTQFADDIWRSWDGGNSWEKVGFSDQVVNGITYAYSNNRFAMIGYEGRPIISTNNGDSWFFSYDTNVCPTGPNCSVGHDIAWTSSTLVVVRGWVPQGPLSSNDGVNWTNHPVFGLTTNGVGGIDTVAFGNGQFVAAGQSGIYRAEIPPKISSSLTSSNSIHLVITSQPGRSYWLQSSSNLTSWTNVTSFSGSSVPSEFYLPLNTNLPALVYRVFEP
jgi:hypothetical protein